MPPICCRKCKKEIEKYGIVAEVVYEHVCQWYADKKYAVEMTQKELDGICCKRPVVDFLEKKGFIVTTESGKHSIAIKPVNTCADNPMYFCCGRH